MAVIRRYGDWPAFFVPDEGEVVLAARSPSGPFLKAVVWKVRRVSRGMTRVDFLWMEDESRTVSGVPAVSGGKGHVEIREDDRVPLIRRIPKGYRPRSASAGDTEQGPEVTPLRARD